VLARAAPMEWKSSDATLSMTIDESHTPMQVLFSKDFGASGVV